MQRMITAVQTHWPTDEEENFYLHLEQSYIECISLYENYAFWLSSSYFFLNLIANRFYPVLEPEKKLTG